MKVALLLYGQPRFVERLIVSQSHKNDIINKYDTDVFVHVWSNPSNSEYSSSPLGTYIPDKNAVKILMDEYLPKSISVEESKPFTFKEHVKQFMDARYTDRHPEGYIWSNRFYNNILSQMCSIQKVSKLLQDHIELTKTKYDFIVLARMDAVLVNFPNLNALDNNLFYLPITHQSFPDTIFIFGEKHLEWAANLYTDIDRIYTTVVRHVLGPSAEGFKCMTFLNRHPMSDVRPLYMDAEALRK